VTRAIVVALLSVSSAVCTAANDAPPAEYLQAGPMVGYSTSRETLLWVQTNAKPSRSPQGGATLRGPVGETLLSWAVELERADDYWGRDETRTLTLGRYLLPTRLS